MRDRKEYLKKYHANPINKEKHRLYVQLWRRNKGVKPRIIRDTPFDSREYARDRRVKVLNHYGNGHPECVCCGETRFQFLALDHKNGGGTKHRQAIGKGTDICAWIIRNNFPDDFQILCHNCNCAKGYYGLCPHTLEQNVGFQSRYQN